MIEQPDPTSAPVHQISPSAAAACIEVEGRKSGFVSNGGKRRGVNLEGASEGRREGRTPLETSGPEITIVNDDDQDASNFLNAVKWGRSLSQK